MESLQNRSGCLASPLARVGVGIGMLGVLLVLVLVLLGLGDDDDTALNDQPASPSDGSAPEIPNPFPLPDGSVISIEVFVDSDADTTIIAAPSRNADLSSLRPVGNALADASCANMITFDATTVNVEPLTIYEAIIDALLAGDFGPISDDGFGTLGASFTGLPSWQAARDAGATYNFVFSPSDLFPDEFDATDVPMSSLVIGDGDSGFFPQFEQWQAAGFSGVTVPAPEHGSALFTGTNPDEALDSLQTLLCF